MDAEKYLKNEKFQKIFYEYTKNEKNEESLELYFEIVKFKKIENLEVKRDKLLYLYSEYLKKDSKKEVNLSENLKDSILEKCLREDCTLDDIFCEIEKNLLLTLSDPFIRYSKTIEFKEFLVDDFFKKKRYSNSNNSPVFSENIPIFKKNWSIEKKNQTFRLKEGFEKKNNSQDCNIDILIEEDTIDKNWKLEENFISPEKINFNLISRNLFKREILLEILKNEKENKIFIIDQ